MIMKYFVGQKITKKMQFDKRQKVVLTVHDALCEVSFWCSIIKIFFFGGVHKKQYVFPKEKAHAQKIFL